MKKSIPAGKLNKMPLHVQVATGHKPKSPVPSNAVANKK